jgi:hypothetical protein
MVHRFYDPQTEAFIAEHGGSPIQLDREYREDPRGNAESTCEWLLPDGAKVIHNTYGADVLVPPNPTTHPGGLRRNVELRLLYAKLELGPVRDACIAMKAALERGEPWQWNDEYVGPATDDPIADLLRLAAYARTLQRAVDRVQTEWDELPEVRARAEWDERNAAIMAADHAFRIQEGLRRVKLAEAARKLDLTAPPSRAADGTGRTAGKKATRLRKQKLTAVNGVEEPDDEE